MSRAITGDTVTVKPANNIYTALSGVALVIVREHGANVHDQAQFGPLLRLCVLADVVPYPVRQRADRDLGVAGQRRRPRRVDRHGRGRDGALRRSA